jgi:hypothetical protein
MQKLQINPELQALDVDYVKTIFFVAGNKFSRRDTLDE